MFNWYGEHDALFFMLTLIYLLGLVAMNVEDADNAVLVSSAALNSAVSRQNDVLSSEDLAWVDSCLNKEDYDISESDWIPLRDALLDIISSQSQSFDIDGGEDIETLPDCDKSSIELNQESSTSDAERLRNPYSAHPVNPLSLAAETSDDEILDIKNSGTFPFLPTYNEDLKQNESFDLGFNLDSATYEIQHASENIFKIWDFDIPSEEGELVKQLKKALSENSFPTAPNFGKESSVDDLITGIADLSLNKNV